MGNAHIAGSSGCWDVHSGSSTISAPATKPTSAPDVVLAAPPKMPPVGRRLPWATASSSPCNRDAQAGTSTLSVLASKPASAPEGVVLAATQNPQGAPPKMPSMGRQLPWPTASSSPCNTGSGVQKKRGVSPSDETAAHCTHESPRKLQKADDESQLQS